MSLSFPLIDASTGYEIIAFMRRGRWYWYLRHPRTKRFVRRIRELTVKITVTVDYREELAKKRNPLYVDMTVATVLRDSFEPKDLLDAETTLIDVAHRELAGNFSTGVPAISEVAGIEYFSYMRYAEYYPEVHVEIIWWHREGEKGNETEYTTRA